MEVLSSRVLLHPRDLAASRHFYEQTLGLRVYREYGIEGRVSGVVLFLGGGFLELSGGGPDVPQQGSALRLWLQVPDVDREHGRLRDLVPVDREPETMPWGLREMWIRDPDGVGIVLVEVPPEHPIRRRID